MRLTLLLTLLIGITTGAGAQDTDTQKQKRCNDPNSKVECGWHFGYIDPFGEMETPPESPPPPPPESEAQEKPKEEEPKCSSASSWDESCGFVDPGEDFDFQAKQRDVFLKGLVMKSHSPKAVENMQRYMKWVVAKAIEASKIWEFNLVQKPELSASVQKPVVQMGMNLALTLEENSENAVLNNIKQSGGFFVWFTRTDCAFCHRQAVVIHNLMESEGYPMWNASLDGQCMKGFDETNCMVAPETIEPASLLGIKIVPSLFLYLPETKTWIRVANGLEPKSVIRSRVKNFFLAVRSAIVNEVSNGEGTIPSVDFSHKESEGFSGIREVNFGEDNENN